jgi:hypothetical protein
MAKKPQKRRGRRQDLERELAGQYREIRIRALAGALEHGGAGDKARRKASYTRNKVKSAALKLTYG